MKETLLFFKRNSSFLITFLFERTSSVLMTFPFFFLKRTRLFSSCFFLFLPSARRMPNIFHGLRRKMREIFRKCAWRSLAVTCPCPRRSLAVTCGHSSGCRLCAATCGHLRSLEWLQVADFPKIKYRAACVLNGFFPFFRTVVQKEEVGEAGLLFVECHEQCGLNVLSKMER